MLSFAQIPYNVSFDYKDQWSYRLNIDSRNIKEIESVNWILTIMLGLRLKSAFFVFRLCSLKNRLGWWTKMENQFFMLLQNKVCLSSQIYSDHILFWSDLFQSVMIVNRILFCSYLF